MIHEEKGRGRRELVSLDPDHPGFRDATYRARRDRIARIALEYESGDPIPDAPYVEAEQEVWRVIWEELAPLHEAKVCRELRDLAQELGLGRESIPQLSEVNRRLELSTGFRMEPVAGLVRARVFLEFLARRVFLSTQYIRHSSRPLYTPEPDVVHELVGHAASLTHPGLAETNRRLGVAAVAASEEELQRLERVYWYTLEFGLVEEQGSPKAFGAGLLSSAGELEAFDRDAELRPWDLDLMAATPYDPTGFQPSLFVAPSFEGMLAGIERWLEQGGYRS